MRAQNLFIVFLFCMPLLLYSYTPGSTSMSFLKIPIGARPASLGGAYTGLGEDSIAMFYNPASIGYVPQNEISGTHLEYFESIRYENLAAAFSVKDRYVLGVGICYLYVSDIPKTVAAENIEGYDIIGEFGASDLMVMFCNSIKISEYSYVGLNIKYIRENIADSTASTFAFDVGYNMKILKIKDLKIGVSLLNLGMPLKFIEKKESLPVIFRAGVGWRFLKTGLNPQSKGKDLEIGADIEKPFDNKARLHLGSELKIFDKFFIRVGYIFNFNKNNPNNICIGGGILFKMVRLDYSFVPYNFLGGTHRFSVTVNF